MNRPLVITDCDEVLLHMVRHFRDWLGEAHGIEMVLDGNPFAQALTPRGATEPLSAEDKWRYLDMFFDTEMDRQTAIEGAASAVHELQRAADVVILTNLADRYNAVRSRQLAAHGISARVFTSSERLIPGAAPGEEICQIQVQDNGIGFDAQFVERIFVVFQRLHSRTEFEGTGIGLAICRKITDRHGGTILAKSSEGEGATFVVTLPVRQMLTDADERQRHADHDFDGR